MCGMIVAAGDFDTRDILTAAVSMSCWQTAAHDNRTTRHKWRSADARSRCGGVLAA